MTKKEILKNELLKKDVYYNRIMNEVDLLLENNFGQEIQELFDLVDREKEEFDHNYRTLKLSDVRPLKWAYIESVLKAVSFFIDVEFDFSDATLKKAMKETNFYQDFNKYYTDNLNGETENVEVFKRVLKVN